MRRLSPLVASLALSACSMAPKYVQPALPVPPSWPVGDAYLRQTEAALPSFSYRDIFRDPRLQQIIDRALANNRDLRIAAANIAAARAQYRIQRADLLPQIGVGASYTFNRFGGSGSAVSTTPGSGTGTGTNPGTGTGGTTPGTGGGTNPGTGGGTNPGTGTGGGTNPGTGTGGTGTGGTGGGSGVIASTQGTTSSAFSINGGITGFEIDLFGRIRSLSEAALDRYFAQEATARATRLTLIGDIATAWLNYGADASLMRIAQETAASAQRSVDLTSARLRGGIAPRTDLRQAETVLATAQADLAQQRTQLAQDVNALQLLVGAPVAQALLPASIEQAGQTVTPLPAGLDSTILLRRPDVVQAEYELRATNAEIGAARAALFPRITLTAVLGFASTALGSLFSGDAFNFSAGPDVSYPIFSGGAARAGVEFTQAQRDAALAGYERAIQTAFREVSDELARRGTVADQLAANTRLTNAAADNFRLADARYRGGIDTFLATLDAQRSLYDAQRTLVATQLVGATNLVDLYRTLGGDELLEGTARGPVPVAVQRNPSQ